MIMAMRVPQSVRQEAAAQLSAVSRPAGVPLNLRHSAPTSNSPGQVFIMTAILVQDQLYTGCV